MALREILARFGFQIDQRGLQEAEKGIAGVVGSLRTFGAAIAGSAIVRGISNFVDDITKAGDALGKTATQLGLSGKELQAWQTAAGFAGVEATNLDQSFRVLGKNALLASQGSKQAAEAFRTLGVEIKDAAGNLKPTNQLAREAGVALGSLEDRTKAVGLAQQIFGRTGAKLLPLFKDGATGLDNALAALDRFGGGLSDQLIPLAEASRDRFFEFEIATTSLKSQLAVALLPLLNQVTLGLSKLIAWISRATEGTSLFRSVLIAIGGVLGKLFIAKFGKQLLSLARAAALPLLKFALLVLVVDDLIALFEGRGSVIGTFIDKIFGKGSATRVVAAIKGVGKAVSDVVKTGDFEAFDKALDEIFGPIGHDIVADIVFTFDMIGEALDQFVSETGEGFDLVISDLGTWISDMGSALVNGAAEIANDAIALGEAIIDGIIGAIEDGASAVVTALGNVAKGAIDGAKKFIGANSPSKLAATEVGEPLPEGVAMGAMDAASAAARRTADALSVASTLSRPSSISAPSRGGSAATTSTGDVVFKSQISLTVNGGSASDPQIQKLRQGLRSELRDNRRAMLDALTQRVEAT